MKTKLKDVELPLRDSFSLTPSDSEEQEYTDCLKGIVGERYFSEDTVSWLDGGNHNLEFSCVDVKVPSWGIKKIRCIKMHRKNPINFMGTRFTPPDTYIFETASISMTGVKFIQEYPDNVGIFELS